MDILTPDVIKRIRDLNDNFRRTFNGGVVVLTRGITNLADTVQARLLHKVKTYNAFDEDNDPHAEHDFGYVDLDGMRFYFKLDYYDRSMEMGSPDPSDPTVTKRVLTLMRSDEY